MTAARVEALYARALRLYPAAFQENYAEPMGRALKDALADGALRERGFLGLLFRDLLTSLMREHMAMMRATYGRPALVFNALVLAGMATVLALALNTIPQQVLRLGANDPQIAMATDLAATLEKGGLTEMLRKGALPATDGTGSVDMARSLSPFLIVYDDHGRPLASQAELDGQTPVLPPGVFEYVRKHGQERVSWQPVRGRAVVRIAAVVQRVDGATPGFVLAGRNMREVEAREALVAQLAGLTWLGMMGLIGVGTAVFGWVTRPQGMATRLA